MLCKWLYTPCLLRLMYPLCNTIQNCFPYMQKILLAFQLVCMCVWISKSLVRCVAKFLSNFMITCHCSTVVNCSMSCVYFITIQLHPSFWVQHSRYSTYTVDIIHGNNNFFLIHVIKVNPFISYLKSSIIALEIILCAWHAHSWLPTPVLHFRYCH